MRPDEIEIDQEFAALIRPLSDDERSELEASIAETGGARDALVVWDRGGGMLPILLDGHNRLEICRRLGLPFQVTAMTFDCRAAAANWMQKNQIGRRNLSRQSFAMILGRLYNRTKRMGGGKRLGRTADQFAHEYGMDEKTVRRAALFQEAAEKLGIESEVASGKVRVCASRVIAAAKSIRPDSTPHAIAQAKRKAKHTAKQTAKTRTAGRHESERESQSWLLPADPAECLKAIDFYARSYMVRAPRDVDAMARLFIRLAKEARAIQEHVACESEVA